MCESDRAALKYKARLKVFREGTSFGPGTAELMELIEETSSLAEGCARMGMAYSKGWKILKRAESDLGIQLIVSCRGGRSGGRTELTDKGREFLQAYRHMEEEMNQTLERAFEVYFGKITEYQGEQR